MAKKSNGLGLLATGLVLLIGGLVKLINVGKNSDGYEDDSVVHCPKCGTIMDHRDGAINCPNCYEWGYGTGKKDAVFRDEILRRNSDWDGDDNEDDEDDDDYYEYYDDDDDDDKGPGCRACGNPAYPKCMDSCPMFDD